MRSYVTSRHTCLVRKRTALSNSPRSGLVGRLSDFAVGGEDCRDGPPHGPLPKAGGAAGVSRAAAEIPGDGDGTGEERDAGVVAPR